jgi:hypothetical protein
MKRAAHFLLVPELAYSPPNDAIVNALLELGCEVDLFAPGGNLSVDVYGPKVTANHVEYGKRWIMKNILSPRWRSYDIFSGTAEDPMSIVGLLSRLYRKPSFTLADEIRFGGNRSERWKKLCKSGMRRSSFTIVNDESRIPLQRAYVNLPDSHQIIVYPGCFRKPPDPGNRKMIRSVRGIPDDSFVLCFSGTFFDHNGGLWMTSLLESRRDLFIWGQLVGKNNSLITGLLKKIRGSERLFVEKNRMSWQEAWASMSAVDVGMVVYLHNSPQFQNMGISSNRLCMFLAMGVPVIASRQSSFKFIEQYDCGVLVDNEEEFIDAIDYVKERHSEMRMNALLCAQEYINAQSKYDVLKRKLSEF